jgi:hypothetical protein
MMDVNHVTERARVNVYRLLNYIQNENIQDYSSLSSKTIFTTYKFSN